MAMEKESYTEDKEIRMEGSPASPGIAIGTASVYERKKHRLNREQIESEETGQEVKRFGKALGRLEEELTSMRDEASDEKVTAIIEAQIEILNDPELHSKVKKMIADRLHSADHAVHSAFEQYIKLLSNSANNHTRERSVDLSDIRDRLLQLMEKDYSVPDVGSNSIVVGKELSPREVVKLASMGIEGIIMEKSGPTSHAAIIARSMGIAAVVGARHLVELVSSGMPLAMDGARGEVVIHPSEETLEAYREKESHYRMDEEKVEEIGSRPNQTKDGRPFSLMANIEFTEELKRLDKTGAKGIGLLRTESVYLEREHFDDMDHQLDFYRTVMQGAGDYSVTIRLFDAGGDKILHKGRKERNPFLGWRGIRMLLDEQEILRNQLEAILTVAGEYPGRLRILVPMVTVPEEVDQLAEIIGEIQDELESRGKAVDRDVKTGIMVEVPAVALQLEAFIAKVDFLSIGTNDLTQYLLAVDRGNELISTLYDQRAPVIWKVIERVAAVAGEHDMEVSVCGELASDPVSAACLLGMGIRELSMNPGSIPAVKKVLTEYGFRDMELLSKKTLECERLGEVVNLFNEWSR